MHMPNKYCSLLKNLFFPHFRGEMMTELSPCSLALLGISILFLRTPREQWDTIVLSEGKRVREKACGLGEDKSWATVTRRSCQERRQNCGEWEGPGDRVPGAAQAGQALTGQRFAGSPLLDAGLSLRTSDPAGPPRGSLSHKPSWAPPGRHGGSGLSMSVKSSVDWSQEEVLRAPSGWTQEPLCDLGGGNPSLAGSHHSQKWWLGSDSGL